MALLVLNVNFVMQTLVWPLSFTTPNALRAAGDAKFTMIVSIISMWVFRIGMSYVLGSWMQLGLLGVWAAMQIDWVVRGIIFTLRFHGHRWEAKHVIDG